MLLLSTTEIGGRIPYSAVNAATGSALVDMLGALRTFLEKTSKS